MSTTLDPKDPDQSAEYGIDFHDEVVTEATRRTYLSLGAVVFFPQVSGWYFEVTTAGRTERTYPHQIPREDGETVNDGSCVLTCRHPDSASLPTISSATWDIPSGLTLASQRQSGLTAFVTVAGGTDGEDYEVTCHMTPSVGNAVDRTITIPVRAQ